MHEESRTCEASRRTRLALLSLFTGAVVIIGLASMTPPAAAAKQLNISCPGETMRSVTLASGDSDIVLRVGGDCTCATSQATLDMGVEIATRDLILAAIGQGDECPSCGAKIEANAKFCSNCGEKLDATPAMKSGHIRCPACGTAVRPKVDDLAGTFCSNCGAMLRGHLDNFWNRLTSDSSTVQLSGRDLPGAGNRSSAAIYCHEKTAIYLYWKQMLRAEMEQAGKPPLPQPRILTLNISREQAAAGPEQAGTQEGVTWDSSGDVSTEDYKACLALATTFTEQCDEVAARWAELDCQRSGRQSGCLFWKVGCFSPYTPSSVFSEVGCSTPGFYACAAATYPGYIGCVDSCNTAKDRGKCLHERCQAQAKISFSRCGNEQTAGSAWREPSGGSPEAQPGSDVNVIGAMAGQTAPGVSEIAEAFSMGGYGGAVLSGEVFMLQDGRRIPIHPGGVFLAGLPIVADSSASVVLPDGTLVKIAPMGVFSYDYDQHLFMPQMGTFHLNHGADSKLNKAWRNVKRAARNAYKFLRVVATGMRVGLLGTDFIVETDPDTRIDRILVHEGELEVEGKVSGKVKLSTGQMATVRGGVLEGSGTMTEATWNSALRSIDEGGASDASATISGGSAHSGGATVGAAAAGHCSGIEGRWRWFNGVMVECFTEGWCEGSNGFRGPWKCLDPSGRFEIHWARPGQQSPYVDTLTLSSDAWEMEGVNQSGQGVGGRRPEFTGGDPASGCDAIIGKWRWSGGAVVECGPDQTCTSSNGLSGPWRCINDKAGRFEIRWARDGRPDQFIDTFIISPMGSYLTGKNQYGVAMGAVRE